MTKRSAAQWRSYVDGLGAAALVEQAEAANTAGFVRALQDEGYDADEVTAVLATFARRFNALGQLPPPGGYVDLLWLAGQP